MNIIKKIALLLAIVFSYCQSVTAQEDILKVTWDGGSKEVNSYECGGPDSYDLGLLRVDTQLTFEFGDEINGTENSLTATILVHKNIKYIYKYTGYCYVKVKYVTGYASPYFKVEISEHTSHTIGDTDKPTEPTCTTKGLPGKCTECGQWIWDTSTTTISTDYKPALGHDFTDQNWITGEENGGKYRTCTRSGCEHKQYSYDVVPGEPTLGITLNDGETLTYPQSLSPVYAKDGTMWKVKLGETTACEMSLGQVKGIVAQWPHSSSMEHQCADKSWADGCSIDDCAEGRTQRWVNINGNKVETTAITGELAIASLTLNDDNGYECEAEYTANAVSYGRTMSNQWGTLCLPFEIKSDQDATCKFYELKEVKETEIVLTEITADIPAGTPVLVRRITESTDIELLDNNVTITPNPIDGSSAGGLSLVGRFTQLSEMPSDAYVFGDEKFWLTRALTGAANEPEAQVDAFRAYLDGEYSATILTLSTGAEVPTDIVKTLNDLTSGEAEYYDLSGRRMNGLQKGVNLVRKNGTTTKIIIR